jgi:hypothetical protein
MSNKRATMLRCSCQDDRCTCSSSTGHEVEVDLRDGEPARIALIEGGRRTEFDTWLMPRELEAIESVARRRANGGVKVQSGDTAVHIDDVARRSLASSHLNAGDEGNNMTTIFDDIKASSLNDRQQDRLLKEVSACHSNATRLGLGIDASGRVDLHELGAALKRKYPEAWLAEIRFREKARFAEHGVTTQRTA